MTDKDVINNNRFNQTKIKKTGLNVGHTFNNNSVNPKFHVTQKRSINKRISNSVISIGETLKYLPTNIKRRVSSGLEKIKNIIDTENYKKISELVYEYIEYEYYYNTLSTNIYKIIIEFLVLVYIKKMFIRKNNSVHFDSLYKLHDMLIDKFHSKYHENINNLILKKKVNSERKKQNLRDQIKKTYNKLTDELKELNYELKQIYSYHYNDYIQKHNVVILRINKLIGLDTSKKLFYYVNNIVISNNDNDNKNNIKIILDTNPEDIDKLNINIGDIIIKLYEYYLNRKKDIKNNIDVEINKHNKRVSNILKKILFGIYKLKYTLKNIVHGFKRTKKRTLSSIRNFKWKSRNSHGSSSSGSSRSTSGTIVPNKNKNIIDNKEFSANYFLTKEQYIYISEIITEFRKKLLDVDIIHDDFNDVKKDLDILCYDKYKFNYDGNEVTFYEIYEFVFYYIKLMNANYFLNNYYKKQGHTRDREITITDINNKFKNLKNMMSKYGLYLSDIPDYDNFLDSFPKLNNNVCFISSHGDLSISNTFIIPDDTYIITLADIGNINYASTLISVREFIYNNHIEIKHLVNNRNYIELKKLLSILNNKLINVDYKLENTNIKLHTPGMTISDTYISFYESDPEFNRTKLGYTNQYMGYKIYTEDNINNDMNIFTVINKNGSKHTMNTSYTSTIVDLMGPGIYFFSYCRTNAKDEHLILSQNNLNNNRIKHKRQMIKQKTGLNLNHVKTQKYNNYINLSSDNNNNNINNNINNQNNNSKSKVTLTQIEIERNTQYYTILYDFYVYIHRKKEEYKKKNKDKHSKFIDNIKILTNKIMTTEYNRYIITIIINNIINIYSFLFYLSIGINNKCNNTIYEHNDITYNFYILKSCLYFDNNINIISDLFLVDNVQKRMDIIYDIIKYYLSMQFLRNYHKYKNYKMSITKNLKVLHKSCRLTLVSFSEYNPLIFNHDDIAFNPIKKYTEKYSEYLKEHIIKYIIYIVYNFLEYPKKVRKDIIKRCYNRLSTINEFTSTISNIYMILIETICIFFHIKGKEYIENIKQYQSKNNYHTEIIISSLVYELYSYAKNKVISSIYVLLQNTNLNKFIKNIKYIKSTRVKKKNKPSKTRRRPITNNIDEYTNT